MASTKLLTYKNETESSLSTSKMATLLPILLAASISTAPAYTSEARLTYEMVQVSNTYSHTVEIRRVSKNKKRASLVKKLLSIREHAIANGMSLLDHDGVITEVKSRRGEEA